MCIRDRHTTSGEFYLAYSIFPISVVSALLPLAGIAMGPDPLADRRLLPGSSLGYLSSDPLPGVGYLCRLSEPYDLSTQSLVS